MHSHNINMACAQLQHAAHIFKRENREIPVAQLLSTYDRAVVHFKIVYKTSFGHITIHFYRRLRKNNFNYAVVQDYNTSILSSLETRPYYKTVLAQRRHNQSLLSATTTYSIVNWCGIRHFLHVYGLEATSKCVDGYAKLLMKQLSFSKSNCFL